MLLSSSVGGLVFSVCSWLFAGFVKDGREAVKKQPRKWRDSRTAQTEKDERQKE